MLPAMMSRPVAVACGPWFGQTGTCRSRTSLQRLAVGAGSRQQAGGLPVNRVIAGIGDEHAVVLVKSCGREDAQAAIGLDVRLKQDARLNPALLVSIGIHHALARTVFVPLRTGPDRIQTMVEAVIDW